jgi:5-methylcytosine-specific restriction endonuclease McrA
VYEDNIKKFGTLTCELCIQPCEFGQDALEHFHPISRRAEYGGDINERKNLGVAHKRCNESKGSKTLVEWIEKRRACVPC